MSLVNLSHVCSHLKNCSKARLAITSIPLTKLHYKLSIALRDAGFLSAVVHGGPKPPPTDLILNLPSVNSETEPLEPITRENIASRRIWLGLKYWQSEPVIHDMQMVSKPTRRINLNVRELKTIIRGDRAGMVQGLRSPGECIFLSTDQGVLEARDCVEKNVGGLALCRVV
ncbi:hypothetical protein VTO42DRAFT_5711 [Malbranchea cinnamomea]